MPHGTAEIASRSTAAGEGDRPRPHTGGLYRRPRTDRPSRCAWAPDTARGGTRRGLEEHRGAAMEDGYGDGDGAAARERRADGRLAPRSLAGPWPRRRGG
nr:unnamed protein product [Digitaria exilis]